MLEIYDEVFAYLKSAQIAFDLIRHDPVSNMEECMPGAEKLRAVMPRNLFLTPRNRSAYHLVIVPPFAPFRTADISKQLSSSRLSFAPPEKLMEYMRTQPGAISPMGLIFDKEKRVRFAMDRALLDAERLAFHPCISSMTLAMSRKDFLKYLGLLGYEVITVDTSVSGS